MPKKYKQGMYRLHKTLIEGNDIIPYDPLSDIKSSLLSPAGLKYVRSDKYISETTETLLRESEKSIAENPRFQQYRYLLQEHNAEEVVNQYFLAHDRIGLAHVAGIVKENPFQSFAEIVAAYSGDCNIPFIFSMSILKDLLDSNKNLSQYISIKIDFMELIRQSRKTACETAN